MVPGSGTSARAHESSGHVDEVDSWSEPQSVKMCDYMFIANEKYREMKFEKVLL